MNPENNPTPMNEILARLLAGQANRPKRQDRQEKPIEQREHIRDRNFFRNRRTRPTLQQDPLRQI